MGVCSWISIVVVLDFLMSTNTDRDDVVYYTIERKTGAGRMFFNAPALVAYLGGRLANNYIVIKEDYTGPRFVSLTRVGLYDLEKVLLAS